tara:strand:+ start:31028 stop:33289 length:2262 start_codon:yes stop_codon:yes gene_type:complete
MQFKKSLMAASVLVAVPVVSYAQLEEVVVTASKRSESLQDVPMAITAISAEQITRLGASDFADLATTVPSLSLRSSGPGRTKLNIRGISAATGVAPTVSFYIDEMPIQIISSGSSTSFQQANLDPKLYDLERIEVLRGPQGTLYGSSSMGGTVRLITRQPAVGENEGSINFDLSNTEKGGVNYIANGMANLATGDNSALRAIVSYTDRDGYYDRVDRETGETFDENVNTEQTTAVRLTYRYEFENAYIQPSVFYQDLEMDGKPNYYGPDDEFEQPALFDAPEPYEDQFTMGNLTYGHSLSGVDLLASLSYIERDTDNTEDITDATNNLFAEDVGPALMPVFADESVDLEDTTFEARINSNNNERLHWLGGIYYKDSEADAGYRMQRGFDPAINPAGLANTQDKRTYEEYAVFSEVTWEFLESFSLTLGGRYLDYTYEQFKEDWGLAFSGGPRDTANQLDLSISDQEVQGKLTGTWHYTEDSQLYATVSNGTRPGGGNRTVPRSTNPADTIAFACNQDLNELGIAGTPDSFEGDEVINYEFGWKATLSDAVRFNGAIYHMQWDDIQQVVTTSGTCGVNFTTNIGEAETQGAELELLAAVTENFTVSLAAGYTEAEFQDDVPQAGIESGDQLADVPEWTANVTLDYVIPVDTGEFFMVANYNYVDETLELAGEAGDDLTDNGIISGNRKPDYDILNLRVGFTSADNWEWLVYVDNVTDEEAIYSYSDALAFNLTSYDRTVRNRPRTFGTSFTYNF